MNFWARETMTWHIIDDWGEDHDDWDQGFSACDKTLKVPADNDHRQVLPVNEMPKGALVCVECAAHIGLGGW